MKQIPQKYNTSKSIDTLLQQITSTTSAKKVIETALQEVKEKLSNKAYEPRHCGLIAQDIYIKAEVKQQEIYRDTNYHGKIAANITPILK